MKEKHNSHHSSGRKSTSSRARKLFFFCTAFWGYFIAWAAVFICCRHCGFSPSIDLFIVSVIVGSAVVTGIGSLVFHRAYREYRKKKFSI